MRKNLSKKEILKAPQRKWNDTSKLYDRIWIIPAGTKHDSGYMHIAIVGVTNGPKGKEIEEETYEICAYPDDISTLFTSLPGVFSKAAVRMDCFYPSGILQYHTRQGKFHVSEALSSVDITLVPLPQDE